MTDRELARKLAVALKAYAGAMTARTQRQAHIDAMEALSLAEKHFGGKIGS